MKELQKRKPTRLKGYDYSLPGAYFVTICTRDKKCILGNIVGKGFHAIPQNIQRCESHNNVEEGFHALPQNKLTPIGKEIEKTIQYINENYNNILIDKYVIMPNHIHLIVVLKDSGGHGNPPLQNVIGQLKSYTTKKVGTYIWQRSYHDHIIRGDEDYQKIWEYIDTNPLRWELDCFYNGK